MFSFGPAQIRLGILLLDLRATASYFAPAGLTTTDVISKRTLASGLLALVFLDTFVRAKAALPPLEARSAHGAMS